MNPTRAHRIALALCLLAVVAAPPAMAQPERDSGLEPSLVVLELYISKQEYAKTREYVERVTEEIGKTGRYSVLTRDDADRQIRAKMTTSSRRVTEDKLREIEAMMKKGDELLYRDPRQAIEILAKAKQQLKKIMESISLNQKIREDFFKTQMLLARSHLDNGNEEKAQTIMEEIIRVFGDEAQVTEADYHPNIVRLFREAYRKMANVPKGSIHVTTLPKGAEVLIHGKPQKRATPATYTGLYPGSVSIQARKNGRESMIHKEIIEAGQTRELTIDIDYETSLFFNDTRFGFEFADADTIEQRVAEFASRIGKMLRVDYVLVSGLVDHDGRTHIEGYMVNVSKSRLVRSKSLYTKANVVSKNRVKSLALNMAGYDLRTKYKPWYTRYPGWIGVGVAVIGAVVGGVMWANYESKLEEVTCTEPPPACKSFVERTVSASDAKTSRSVAGVGFGAIVVGAAGAVLGFLLFEEEDIDASVEVLGDGSTAEGPKLKSLGPTVTRDGSVGVGATFSF